MACFNALRTMRLGPHGITYLPYITPSSVLPKMHPVQPNLVISKRVKILSICASFNLRLEQVGGVRALSIGLTTTVLGKVRISFRIFCQKSIQKNLGLVGQWLKSLIHWYFNEVISMDIYR